MTGLEATGASSSRILLGLSTPRRWRGPSKARLVSFMSGLSVSVWLAMKVMLKLLSITALTALVFGVFTSQQASAENTTFRLFPNKAFLACARETDGNGSRSSHS